MNATEHMVEVYFRLCRGCFTYSDVKVPKGNNRQLDLLAINLHSHDQYHVEVGVSHQLNWVSTVQKLFTSFDKKYLGVPPRRAGAKTDHAKGKSYFTHIVEAYTAAGLNPAEIQRVWVCWFVRNPDEQIQLLAEYSKQHHFSKPITILSFRDDILPALMASVATSHYDDEVLRSLSLLKQRDVQIAAASAPCARRRAKRAKV